VSLSYAAPDPWADDDDGGIGTELGLIRWAAETAGQLADELRRLAADVGAAAEAKAEAARAQRLWDLPGRPFAQTRGHCLHTRSCGYVNQSPRPMAPIHQPLTTSQAEAFLRETHEHRRCSVCHPDIPGPVWVRVVSAGGQVRFRLADDVNPPGEVL
jgi:hypothetical protein